MTELTVFCGYLLMLLAATTFARRRAVRGAYVVVFFAILVAFGARGRATWPFYGWPLYAHESPTTFTYGEFRVADAAGNELKYDVRAVPPSLPSPLRRLAKDVPDLGPERFDRLAAFLLERAVHLREALEGNPELPLWPRHHLPLHQVGYRWTPERLASIGPFTSIRVVRLDTELTPDARTVARQETTLIARYP